ncbi:hypothetical protein EJ419_02170 [Alloscardovia theropitheci]|uniref:Uncharacterized protein n=1 Tax=Alloscardovia theropitheci TaxID=2496842 RepID=A0A4R0QQQ7_9BIFI|nr:hypothetical protein [Alloscardovia theropitheci]TCD54662.1 hypothetical protein EJ419_02170 [Alloscardovia theropitheci]
MKKNEYSKEILGNSDELLKVDRNAIDYERLTCITESIGRAFASVSNSIDIKPLSNALEMLGERAKINFDSTILNNITENIKPVIPTPNFLSKLAFNNLNFEAFDSISKELNVFLVSYQESVLKELSEQIKKFAQYENAIREKIIIKNLAENGWVLYYNDSEWTYNIGSKKIESVQSHWIRLLTEDIERAEVIKELKQSEFIPEILIDSMIQSYRSQNYYAAYTLATIIIDGALNRIAEKTYDASRHGNRKVIVGYKTISILNSQIINLSISDYGLMIWLGQFYADTKNFTIDNPNRHMINHGRWEKEISKEAFLKIFNSLLYVEKLLKTRISYE